MSILYKTSVSGWLLPHPLSAIAKRMRATKQTQLGYMYTYMFLGTGENEMTNEDPRMQMHTEQALTWLL